MITMKDIAKACGVSISLVSRIINKDETLKCRQETIDKVLKEIEKTISFLIFITYICNFKCISN